MPNEKPTHPTDLPPLPVKHMAASLVIPGLGHAMAKRWFHAAIFGISTWALLITGLMWSNMTALDWSGHPVYYVMQMAGGVLMWVVGFGGFAKEPLIGETVTVTNQMIGVCYCAVGGILNGMAVLELARHGISMGTLDGTVGGMPEGTVRGTGTPSVSSSATERSSP